MSVQRLAAFVVVGVWTGRRRSGIEVAKRIIRVRGVEEVAVEEEVDIVVRVVGGSGRFVG